MLSAFGKRRKRTKQKATLCPLSGTKKVVLNRKFKALTPSTRVYFTSSHIRSQ